MKCCCTRCGVELDISTQDWDDRNFLCPKCGRKDNVWNKPLKEMAQVTQCTCQNPKCNAQFGKYQWDTLVCPRCGYMGEEGTPAPFPGMFDESDIYLFNCGRRRM